MYLHSDMDTSTQIPTFSPDRLRAARDAAKLTRQAVARIIGTTERTLFRWETGESMPGADDLYRLADVLGVRVDDLRAEAAS